MRARGVVSIIGCGDREGGRGCCWSRRRQLSQQRGEGDDRQADTTDEA